RAARVALLDDELAASCGQPVALGRGIGPGSGQPGHLVAHRAPVRIMPLVGAGPAPPTTSTFVAPSIWLIAVPRIWRTASFTWVMPCVYASARFPPCVFTGSGPSSPRLPAAAYGPPSPL